MAFSLYCSNSLVLHSKIYLEKGVKGCVLLYLANFSLLLPLSTVKEMVFQYLSGLRMGEFKNK